MSYKISMPKRRESRNTYQEEMGKLSDNSEMNESVEEEQYPEEN